MVNNKRGTNSSKTFEGLSAEEHNERFDEHRQILENAFLKVCGIRQEALDGQGKLLDDVRVSNLETVLRGIRRRPQLLIRDADAIKVFLNKLSDRSSGERIVKLTASDVSFLAKLAKPLSNSLILTILDIPKFRHPGINAYLCLHRNEKIKLLGRDEADTVETLSACESTLPTRLRNMKEHGGLLDNLELVVLCALYREHLLNLKCACCGPGNDNSVEKLNVRADGFAQSFAKIWKSINKGGPCRLSGKEVEEVLEFLRKDEPNLYGIETGVSPDWLPLKVDTDELEFLQGLEDLKANARLEELDWPEVTFHKNKVNRRYHNLGDEIWQSTKLSKSSNPASSFSDPELKSAVDNLPCEEAAYMFQHWTDKYPPGMSHTFVLSSRSMSDLFKNLGRKFRDAEENFRRTRGGNEPIAIKSIEAVSIHRSYVALTRRLEYTERQVQLQKATLTVRDLTIHGLTHLYLLYQDKMQELLQIKATKKFRLYGAALKDQHVAGKELSRLKVHYDLQTTKMDLLVAELDLLAAINQAANCKIKTLEDVIKSIGGPCSHCDSPLKADSMSWKAMEKEIENRKQAAYRAIRKLVSSQIDAQPLKGTQDWDLLRLLFDYLLEKDRKVVDQFVEEVYGSCIGLAHKNMLSGVQCKEYLLKVRGQNDEPDPKLVEKLCLATGWKSFLPADMTDCCVNSEIKWVSSLDFRTMEDAQEDSFLENKRLREELDFCEEVRDTAILEAKKWREHYDFHLVQCKKGSAREDVASSCFLGWTEDTLQMLDTVNEAPRLGSEKQKLSAITAGIRAIIKERDDAIRRNEPLSKQLLRKEQIIDEKTKEVARVVETRSAREELLKESNTRLELALESKALDVEKARKQIEKVKEEWNKKIQKGHDKVGALEAKLSSKVADFDTMKLDYETTQSQLEKSKKETAKYKETLQKASVKFKNMEREREESKSLLLSLRSNQKAENDRLDKAVRDAEAPKNAIIARLQEEVHKLNQDRHIDEASIRDLSRAKLEYKDKNSELLAHAQALENVNQVVTQEAQELRAKVADVEALQELYHAKTWEVYNLRAQVEALQTRNTH